MTEKKVGLEHIDAPWRMEYIAQSTKPKSGDCIFCCKPCEDESCDRANYVLYRGQHCFIIMNAFPYNGGHSMVIPFRHISKLHELTAEEQFEMMQLAVLLSNAMTKIMSPDGFNLGMNIGQAGGAGIAEHLHLHVVPRWVGDTNFMTTIGNSRVLPEAIEQTWERLKGAITELLAEKIPEQVE